MSNREYHNSLVDVTSIFYEHSVTLIRQIGTHLKLDISAIEHLCETFVGPPLKLKAKKDPLLPKRPKSAYAYFCSNHRPSIREENPEFKLPDVSKALGRLWGKIKKKDKQEFDKLAQVDKLRYEKEMDTYRDNNPLNFC